MCGCRLTTTDHAYKKTKTKNQDPEAACAVFKTKTAFLVVFTPGLDEVLTCIVPDVLCCVFCTKSLYIPNIKDNWDTCRSREMWEIISSLVYKR